MVETLVVAALGSSKMVVNEVVVGEDVMVETEIAGIRAAGSKNCVGRTSQTVGE